MPKFESYAQGTPCYVELTTPDQQAAKAFYGQLFGWSLAETPVSDQGDYYVTASVEDDAVAGISAQMPELAGHPAFWGVYLAVDDVDAAAAKVAPAGGKVEAGPFDVMDLGRMAAIQDPTGARVNLWQARSTVGSARANEPGTPIWNELVSPDLPTATRFYADVLGVAWESYPMADEEYYLLKVGDHMAGGAMPPMMEGMPPHWNVYFNVVDVDGTIVRAEELGAKVIAPAFDVPDVGRMAVLADPDGGAFCLMASTAAA